MAKDKTSDSKSDPGLQSGAPLLPSDKKPEKITKPKTAGSKKGEPAKPPMSEAESDWLADSQLSDSIGIEAPATNKAVDEIMAEESDKLLGIGEQPKPAAESKPQPAANAQPREAAPGFVKRFFKSKRFRRIFAGLLLLGLAVALAIPTSRYYLLNAAGVRASSSMTVLDKKTGQPLKNSEISLGGQTAKTDEDGKARLYNVRLGSQKLQIKKPAFAELDKDLIIGWGSNPLGDFKLEPVGARYSFVLTDYVSGKPIKGAEANSGVASAVSNAKGELVLTVEKTDDSAINIAIIASNYRKVNVKTSASEQATRKISMVLSRKHVFVSNRDGAFDVYKIDVDGKNEQKILAGSGTERADNISIISHPTDEIVAIVSTKGNLRDNKGNLLSVLNIIDLSNNQVTEVARSEQIQVIDWVGNKLVYVKVMVNAKDNSPTKQRLISFDYKTNEEKGLGLANYFNDFAIAQGVVFYAPALYKTGANVGLFAINPDGSNKKTFTKKETWNIFRTSYDGLSISLGQDWYDLSLPYGSFKRAAGAPATLVSRIYYDSPSKQKSLWTEIRDGKGALIVYTLRPKSDKLVLSQSGIKNPLRWLDEDHIVFRVSNGQETADYVYSLSGGNAKKVIDVTNTAGIDRWYNY